MKRGATLVELLIVLVVLGIVLGTVPLLLRSEPTSVSDWRTQLLDARRRSVSTGLAVSGFSDSTGRFTTFPEGMVVADSARARDAR
jgi:prepilin-type N-terminal cleavage/methylation domain-containing protein